MEIRSGDNYILSEREILLMAAMAGIKRIYGFQLQVDQTEREANIQVLNELVKKGYVLCDGGFTLTGEMKRIFSLLGNADTVLEVHKRSGRKCLIYIGKISVRMSMSLRRKECFEISEIPLGNVWDYLQEEGWVMEEKG